MSRRRSPDRPEFPPDESRTSERGDTLIEVLLAIVILGIAGVALLTGFATSITASASHRSLATLDASVRAASNQAISQVQQSNVFGPNTCTNAAANPTTNTSFSPMWSLAGSFTVTSYNAQYWSGTAFSSSCTNPYGPQLWTMTIASGRYSTQVSTVIYDPSAPPVTGGTTPSKLVFMQPTATAAGSGTVNAAVSPQPIVAIEATNSDIVYSDASSVTLTASGGTGRLSSNCSGIENNGVVSFSGCSFSAPGTYTVTASDSSLTTAIASYTITTAPVAKVVFTSSALTQVASAKAGTRMVTVQEQDAFGTPDPGALTVNLSSTSSTGMFSLSSGGTIPITSVSIPAGQSSASFYYGDTTAGSPALSASASALQAGVQTETITGATPVKMALTATPTSAGVSNTTNVALGLQLIDQYGNNTAAGSSGVSLTLSTSSSKGFFSTSNNASGGVTATIAFASGAGTATEYYGDKTVGTPTITAKNGTSIWATAPLTMTVGPPATISLNSGSGQSTLVNTGFTNPLVTTVTDAFGNPVSGVSVTFSASASGASGSFGTCSGGNPQTYQCVVTTTASGQASAPALTANTKSGSTYNVTTAASGVTTPPTFSETNTAGSPAQVFITPNPDPSSASSVTGTALGVQLVDQYGNKTTAGTGGISLTLSTSSSKGVFSATNNATGSATATISFASGAGTATEYYGDQAAGSPTITAKKLTATWGTASPTITAKTTGDTMTIVAGNSQSAAVGATFATPLAVQDVDQYGNPVSGVSVTFSAPASGASGSFASGGNCTSNPQTYQCVVTTTASGQASASALAANTTTGTYSVTTAASGVAAPPAFSETNLRVTAASVASGTGTTSLTTGNFTMTSGTTYVITAFASNNGSVNTPTPTVSGTSGPTMTLVATNTFGGSNSPNCYDSNYCYEWAWSFNATVSSTATVSISFTGTPTGDVADVIALGNNSTSTPIVQSSTASGCNSFFCANYSKTVTGNLSNALAAGDISLQILGSDDAMGTAPTWSTLNSNLFFSSASPASMDVNLASPGQQNETTSTSASGYAGNKDWATIALEIKAI